MPPAPFASAGRAWKKLVVYLGIIVACVLIANVSPIRQYLDMASIQELSQRMGWWAILVISLVAVVFPLFYLPRWPVAMICGMLYGVFLGGLIANVLSTVGAWLQYDVTRRFMPPTQADAEGPKERSLLGTFAIPEDKKLLALFFLRVFPLSNSSATNLLAAGMRVKHSGFLLATFFGMIPSTLMYATWGKLLKKPSTEFYLLALGISILMVVIAFPARRYLVPWLQNRNVRNHAV